jgi:serine/threonine protein kinase
MGLLGKLFSKDPTAELFENGLIRCEKCNSKIRLEGLEALTLQPCRRCKRMNFIPKKVGGFWLITPLGGGGMGSVYQSRHPDFEGESFAVKILPKEKQDDDASIKNLMHEIRTMKSIGHHPAIASIVITGSEETDYFMATRYIAGERLDRKIGRLGQLTTLESLLIGLRLLSAVSFTYDRGYLFRDMKPQNVILTKDGACLIDFGICLRLEDTMNTEVGEHVEGSALYYPPERLTERGERANSEIYSLGMVLYHCLTGSPYFTAKDIETITTLNLRKNRLKRSNDRARRLPPNVRQILDRMIQRKPEDRYQSFVELERDLMQVFWGEFGDRRDA